jgi:hypothetical protein
MKSTAREAAISDERKDSLREELELHERFTANHRRWMKRYLDRQEFFERHRWLIGTGWALLALLIVAEAVAIGWIIGGRLSEPRPISVVVTQEPPK